MTAVSSLVTVNDALAKLKFLANDRTASERGRFKQGWKPFADRIAAVRLDRGCDKKLNKNFRNTLTTAAEKDKVDSNTELIIAELCGFDPRSTSWRSENAGKFKSDFSTARFRLERLRAWSIARQVSVDLMFSENRAADPWPCDIDVVCQKVSLPDFGQSLTVKRAVLTIFWDEKAFAETSAGRIETREALANELKAKLEQRGVAVEVYGTEQKPEWELRHVGGQPLGIVPLSTIFEISEIEADLIVEARLMVIDKDLNANDDPEAATVAITPDDDAAKEVEDDPSPIMLADGKPLGRNKRKVLQAISIQSLKQFADQEHGSAVFARAQIKFVKR